MEAVILAGGMGTRIRPLTYTRPKPLLPVLDRPLLQHIIDRMPKSIRKIVFPVNYLREQVEAYFEEHPDPRVVLVEEVNPLGTGGAIKNCEDELSGPFLVHNGDIVSSIDLTAFVQAHQERKPLVTISLWGVEDPSPFGCARLDGANRILEFVEKPKPGTEPSKLVNAGHYLLDPQVLDAIPPGRFYSLEKELFQPWTQQGQPIYGFPFRGYWIDCGRPESFLEAHRAVLAERGESRWVHPEAKVDRSATVTGYAVAQGCRIAEGARVQGSVLLPEVRLGKNVTVRDCILGEGVEVEDGTVLERSVVGDFGVIEAGRRIQDQRVGMRPVDVGA